MLMTEGKNPDVKSRCINHQGEIYLKVTAVQSNFKDQAMPLLLLFFLNKTKNGLRGPIVHDCMAKSFS